jgi:hypothetical protein
MIFTIKMVGLIHDEYQVTELPHWTYKGILHFFSQSYTLSRRGLKNFVLSFLIVPMKRVVTGSLY